MPAVQYNNVYGLEGGLDLQRGDLWVLDFRNAINYINAIDFTSYKAIQIDKTGLLADSMFMYARSLTMPEIKLSAINYIQGTAARTFNGYAESVGTVAIEFINSVKILTLLTAWKALVRAGRSSYNDDAFYLQSASRRLLYRFNIDLYLLEPVSVDELSAGFNISSKHTLSNCWLKKLQFSNLDRSTQAAVHTISVELQPDAIK